MLRIKGVVESAPSGVEDGDLWRVDIDGRMRGVMRYADGRSRVARMLPTAEGATPRVPRVPRAPRASLPTLNLVQMTRSHQGDGQDECAGHACRKRPSPAMTLPRSSA